MNTDKRTAAIITGGGRGLGRVIAMRLAREYNILIIARTESDLINTCETVRLQGGNADYIVGDVKHPETAERVIDKLRSLNWSVSTLICNAGIGKSSRAHEIDNDTWDDIIDTNLNGSFYFTRAVLPLFIQQGGGLICFISSVAGIKGYAYEAAYTASKHAQVGLSKSIAKEYAKYNIASVVLCPDFIEGDMTSRTIHGLMKRRNISYEDARRVVEEKTDQNHILSPEEVAEVVATICVGNIDNVKDDPMLKGQL